MTWAGLLAIVLAAAPAPAAAPEAGVPAPAPSSTPGAAPGSEPPRLQLPEGVRPLRYVLDLVADPARDGFSGTVAIDVELDAAQPAIWLHARDLRVASAAVETAGGAVPATLEQVTREGVARLTPERPVGPGRATLRFAFSGDWAEGLVGLHRIASPAGRFVSTQLEAVEARRAFPCFDEPRFKTPFDLSVAVPAGDVAVSNAPAAGEAPAGEGLKRVRFAPTAPLPTYLLYVGAGPFEIAERLLPASEVRPRPLHVRLLAPRGRAAEGAFALEVAAATLPWFEKYFRLAYPYEKLDLVAPPELAAGAMENAGAIAFAPAFLLAGPGAGDEDRRRIALTVAHELAHQWFGDLVTPRWWTEIWLNESFATWIAPKAVDAASPALGAVAFTRQQVEAVMDDDARPSSRAIRKPLEDPAAIGAQFDGMSYLKGAAVLGAFERHAGPERFRDGIARYLAARPHGSGDAGALLDALSRAAGKDLGAPMRTFLDQRGVPLVRAAVACGPRGAELRLAQEPYRPRGAEAAQGSWAIPVCARFEAAGAVREACTLLDGAQGALPLGRACPAWVLPDAGATGTYRWTLPPAGLRALAARGLPRLAPVERASIASAAVAAMRAGAIPPAAALDALAALLRDPEPSAAAAALRALEGVREALLPARGAAFERWSRAAAGARLAAVREGPGAARLRARLVEFLAAEARDPRTLRDAARGGGPGDPPPPELAAARLVAELEAGGPAAYAALQARLPNASPEDRRVALHALTHVGSPAFADVARWLWADPRFGPSERTTVFFASDPRVRAPALDGLALALQADFDGVAALFSAFDQEDLPRIAGAACAPGQEARLRALFEPRLEARPELRSAYVDALEAARACAAWRAADGAAAAAWFERKAPPR